MKNVLYDLRKDRLMTQDKIAQYLNIDRSTYAKLESKKTSTISSDTLNKLASFYDVSVDYLLKNNKDYIEKTGTGYKSAKARRKYRRRYRRW